MFELRCTVRNCPEQLRLRENGLHCINGHHFDQAKEGYWNLLQPQDKKSLNPGDSNAAVLARRRWLERGHANGLIDALKPWLVSPVLESNQKCRTLDLGCGEGSFGAALFQAGSGDFCGIDLSKRAIKMASRLWPQGTWVLANADRVLPVADGTVHRIISLFGRRPVNEIQRALENGGSCIVAVPGEDDLIELREQVQQTGERRSRWETVVEEMSNAGLELAEHQRWQHHVDLEPDAIADALAMTYRGARHSEQTRLTNVAATKVTLSADLILLRKS
jgi:23S rRNA (guanine745-N1)-methyltransferase